MKKLISLVLAIMMVALVGLAFASGDVETDPPAAPALVGARTSDGTVTVSGLDEGDVAHFYKIVGWSNGNWALTHEITEITVEDITLNASNTDGITLAEAELIAANPGTEYGSGTAASADGIVTLTNVEPGTYLVLVVDTNNDTIYNPIFVSSDYDPSNTTHAIDASGNSLGVSPDAKAKKQDLTLDKSIDTSAIPSGETVDQDKRDLAVGDTVPFVVTSKVPTYAENYTNPEYYITDTLSSGLTLNQDSIVVTVEGVTLTAADYEIKNKSASGYTVEFKPAFLKGVHGNPTVTIKYTATLNENAVTHNVDRFVNDVTLTFSNDPTDANNHGTKEDKTNHYSFSIDANINGTSGGERVTKELVKIGVDANGDPITAWQTSDTTKWEGLQYVQGAVFTLTNDKTGKVYTATSGANGELQFNGLDAGNYTLAETSAPEGYVKESGTHAVVIAATYGQDADGNDILTSYSITIDGTATSTYSVTNSSSNYTIEEVTVDNSSETFPLLNTKGVALPSTGGIGTTIFYIVGGLLLVGAAIVLVARRKAEN